MLTIGRGDAVLTAAEMRAAEAVAIAGGVPAAVLMGRAAAAATDAILRRFAPGAALVLCGPGNNGGDGFGIACGLRDAGVAVEVAALAMPPTLPAADFAARWAAPVRGLADATAAPLVIDALFGTGLTRSLAPDVQAAIDRVRAMAATVVAIDLPSGIDSDTGVARGEPLAATLTIGFGAAKRGHLLGAGRRATGQLLVADIGLDLPEMPVTHGAVPRLGGLADDVHKYQRGGVLVIAGGQPGAANLAALAALRVGAGAVTLVGAQAPPPANAIMVTDDAGGRALLKTTKIRAIVVGPGLRDEQRSRDWLDRLLAGDRPLVIDAGALALLAGPPDRFATASAPMVLTPHAGEFARVFGALGPDWVASVQAAAVRSGGVVVLKGRETIIAAPDGRAAINTHAAPWLATAGSGDVLAGMIAGLLAQGLAPFDAARCAVWLHGDAGIRGGAGLIADDLPALLPAVLAGL
jgi:hydroxyethylthiazole kinase-like uncharacterized protein yjeF